MLVLYYCAMRVFDTPILASQMIFALYGFSLPLPGPFGQHRSF